MHPRGNPRLCRLEPDVGEVLVEIEARREKPAVQSRGRHHDAVPPQDRRPMAETGSMLTDEGEACRGSHVGAVAKIRSRRVKA